MTFQLGEWTIDESTNELVREGKRHRLESRAMKVLVYLHQHQGQVVSKDDLVEFVWQLRAVSDHSITVVISDLRRALGDSARQPRFIETISKKGYRLIEQRSEADRQPVATPEVVNPALSLPKRYAAPVLIVACVVLLGVVGLFMSMTGSDKLTLVVLDTENHSQTPELDALSASVTELMHDSLSRIEDIHLVRWRPGQVAKPIRASNAYILAPKLVEGENGTLLSLSLQSLNTNEVTWAAAHAVSKDHFMHAEALALKDLSAHLDLRLPARRLPIFSAETESVYWRARYLWSLRNGPAAHEARDLLLATLDKDPDFWPAHAALADIYTHKTGVFFRNDGIDTEKSARTHLSEAEKMAPLSAETLAAKAHYALFVDTTPSKATRLLSDALAAAPNNVAMMTSFATALAASGRLSDASAAIENASKMDPTDPLLMMDQVWVYFVAGEYEAALESARRASSLGMSADLYEALALGASGQHQSGLDAWLRYLAIRGTPADELDRIRSLPEDWSADSTKRRVYTAIANQLPGESTLLIAMLYGLAGDQQRVVTLLKTARSADAKWVALWGNYVPGLSSAQWRAAGLPKS